MKMYKLIAGAGIVLLAAACESTRQTTTGDNTSTDRANATSAAGPDASMTTQGKTTTSTTNSSMNNSSATNNTSPATTSPATSGNTSTNPATTSPATSGNNNSTMNNQSTQPAATSANTNPSGNAVTMSGNTMANSTINSTTRGDTSVTPPTNIQSSFTTRYPKASNVRWYQYNSTNVPIDWDLTGWPALTNRDYAVTYDVDNNRNYAWYDTQGNWVGSSAQLKDYKGLPTPVTTMLTSKYPGYNITDVHAETYKDRSAYQIEMSKGTDKVKMVVDADGNMLKQKTKTKDAAGNEIKEKTKIQNK